jgi:hypothetical protein
MGQMMTINKSTLLELTDEYINQWHDARLGQTRLVSEHLTDDVRDICEKDVQDAISELAESPFLQFLTAHYQRELKHIFRMLNEPHGTSTTLTPFFDVLGAEYWSNEDMFESALIYTIAAAIHVSGQPEQYFRDGPETGLLKPVMPDKDVVKYAKGLVGAINKQGLQIGDLMVRIIDLANGGQHDEELELVGKASEVAVREIVLITKRVFEVTNNRSAGRFSTSAIERILELIFDLDCLDKPLKSRQISNLQRKFENDESEPLSYNQIGLPF